MLRVYYVFLLVLSVILLVAQFCSRNSLLVQSNLICVSVSQAIGGAQLDPIVKHVQQRKVRLNALIQAKLEAILTDNSSQILHDHLEGARYLFIVNKHRSFAFSGVIHKFPFS